MLATWPSIYPKKINIVFFFSLFLFSLFGGRLVEEESQDHVGDPGRTDSTVTAPNYIAPPDSDWTVTQHGSNVYARYFTQLSPTI